MRTDDKISRLAAVPLFSGLRPRELKRIAQLCTEVIVEEGRVLCHEGDVGGDFFVVEDGTFRVESHGRQVTSLGRGDFFGELALLDHGRRTATVVASSAGRVLVIGAAEFEALLEDEPVVAVRMLPGIGERIRRITETAAAQPVTA
ncbi:MAG: cyclic nucleotide-binding domain-containing protein [Actinomycetes bacterium]